MYELVPRRILRMEPAQERTLRAFALVELLAVTAILLLLALIMGPVAAAARRAAHRSSCTGNLRQIGRAYAMYLADNERYPDAIQLSETSYLNDGRIWFCPADTSIAPRRAAASYHFRRRVPPEFTALPLLAVVEPRVVLVHCDHHRGPQARYLPSTDSASNSPDPHHLALSANGSVTAVHLDRIRSFRLSSDGATVMPAYPEEPGYRLASPPRNTDGFR